MSPGGPAVIFVTVHWPEYGLVAGIVIEFGIAPFGTLNRISST